jgi:hypothetical protein
LIGIILLAIILYRGLPLQALSGKTPVDIRAVGEYTGMQIPFDSFDCPIYYLNIEEENL